MGFQVNSGEAVPERDGFSKIRMERAVTSLYDHIGQTYASTRRPDPRIARAIELACGDATAIVNVGAGTGSYEPTTTRLVAVEPSRAMIRQRPSVAAPVVQAVGEALPFPAGAFDVALAVLTIHHWADWRLGIAEMKRVAKRVVVLAFDLNALNDFWLTNTYFPEIITLDRRRSPSIEAITHELQDCIVSQVSVPHDCVDGFLAAFWRRPEAYLDPAVRASISSFALMEESALIRGITQLESDLNSGVWDKRFGHLRSLDTFDGGYRLVATC